MAAVAAMVSSESVWVTAAQAMHSRHRTPTPTAASSASAIAAASIRELVEVSESPSTFAILAIIALNHVCCVVLAASLTAIRKDTHPSWIHEAIISQC